MIRRTSALCARHAEFFPGLYYLFINKLECIDYMYILLSNSNVCAWARDDMSQAPVVSIVSLGNKYLYISIL